MPSVAQQQKFTPENREKAIELAKSGNYRAVIARAAFGCHPDTFHGWLKKGRLQPDDFPDHAAFLEELEQAEAEWEAQTVTQINATAQSGLPNTWQAGMTMLERKKPDRWGKRETRVIEGEGQGALPQINVLVLNDPDARNAHRDLLRSVDAASRSRPGIPERASVDSELEDGSSNGRDDLDVA